MSIRLIPSAHPSLAKALGGKAATAGSYGLITSDRDHALYVALDEATKASPVQVLYARSLFGGGNSTERPLSGEAIGILVGADDDIVREGLKSALRTLEQEALFYRSDGAYPVPFFAHVIASLGEYLSKEAGLSPGSSMAYMIAPPVESIVALDAALKVSDVKLVKHFAPPTEANYGGGFVAGELEACEAAAQAFADAVVSVANEPREPLDRYVFRKRPTP